MILIDFKSWVLNSSKDLLPNARKELLTRDFETILSAGNFNVLNLGDHKSIDISALFFENGNCIAVSAIQNIADFYEDIDRILEQKQKEVIDYTEAAEEDVFFYGSNSLVAHIEKEIAISGINKYSDESLFEEYCEDFELTPFSFDLSDEYFTSDIALFVGNLLLICSELITDKKVKKQLFTTLKKQDITIVKISKDQVRLGVLDMKFITYDNILLITKKTNGLLSTQQKEQLKEFNLKVLEVPFLEKNDIKLRNIIL